MSQGITSSDLVEAAKALGKEEFTRGDIAAQLGVEKPDTRAAFKEARHQGKLEKVRDDEENTGWFRLTGD